MTARPDVPPASLRASLTDAERAGITAVVGPLPDDLLRPLRDARGRTFQRLEFLGDSVLDLVLQVHGVVERDCPACRGGAANLGRFVTDAALGRQAAAAGVGSWLEWQASAERHADLVEASVAAAWLHGSWTQVVPLIGSVVHPVGDRVASVLVSGGFVVDGAVPRPSLRRTGSALLELAASRVVFDLLPDADEGELSGRRALLHQTRRVAQYARRHGLAEDGPDAALSDAVEEMLAGELLSAGATAAIDAAARSLA